MASGNVHSLGSRLNACWLTLRVHFDAFRLFPSHYLTAAKWWVLRKRVRARAQFAPLLSQSPRAYEFWAMREAARSRPLPAAASVPVLALVIPGLSPADLRATLNSLSAAGLARHLIIDRPLGEIAANVDFAATPWLLTIRAGDRLAPEAGATYAAVIAAENPERRVIYADDDRLDRWGRRIDPHFKPDWNSELHCHHDVITGACILRVDATTLSESGQHEDWDTRLVGTALSQGDVEHIPAVLHHRRSRPRPQSEKSPSIAARLPLVSVIIPTRNHVDLLRTCINGVRATGHPSIEIIIIDNDSDDPATLVYLENLSSEGVTILRQPGPFNYSTINNNAVAISRGELICLMNNDIEVLSPDWLAIMATQALRPEVGAVGAQLLYPDGRIQHAGVVIGVGNAAGHAHRFMRPEDDGYFRRHALPQFVSAVTAACLVVRKEKFLAVGGLDEANFPVAFNDVDLCLKLNARGWQSCYEPRAVLVHHESVSRGLDTDPVGAARFAGELAALQRIWRTNEVVDPYHHPMLSRASEQFALDLTSTMVRL